MPTTNMVLLVEDEPLVRTFATLFLEDLGCPYEIAGSRDEALRLLQDHAEKVAIVFTDMRMSTDDDGAELARIVSRRWSWIALLVTSGGEHPRPAALPGKAKFVSKPWRPDEVKRFLISRLKTASMKAHAEPEAPRTAH